MDLCINGDRIVECTDMEQDDEEEEKESSEAD